ncbi:MAG: tetratricopeptide repeat protein [Nitrospirota bacterium]|nr:tetratricopeptide repeat protein [Nitrospirota bacterium]
MQRVIFICFLAILPVIFITPAGAASDPPKAQLLRLEEKVRNAADSRLTGVPGRPVLVLACSGSTCGENHRAQVPGAPNRDVAALGTTLAAGGWLVLAVDGKPGDPVTVTWTRGGSTATIEARLPPAGSVTMVDQTGDGPVTRQEVPGPEHRRRVAVGLRAVGDLLGAIGVLQGAEGLTPSDRLLLADLYLQADLPKLADGLYRELDAVAAHRAAARLGRARVALALGDANTARKRLDSLALKRDHPLAAEADVVRVAALRRTEVAEDLIQALPAGGNPFVHAARAQTYLSVGDTFSAINEFDEAARLAVTNDPEVVSLRQRALLASASLYADQGRVGEALTRFDRLDNGPLADRVRFGRALAFFRAGDLIKTVAEIDTLERTHPASAWLPEARLMRGDAYRKLAATHQAVGEYRKALAAFRKWDTELDTLLTEVATGPFVRGLTGRLFGGGVTGAAADPPRDRAVQVLLRTPGMADIVADHRQMAFTVARLERLEGVSGQLGNSLQALRAGLEEAAREQVRVALVNEQERIGDLAIAASVGMTQTILFDRSGGRGLVFEDAP